MINYLPERIYNAVKDDADYKTIVNYLTEKKSSCATLEDFVDSDSDDFLGVVQCKQYRTQLENIINKYCPNYLEEYKVNNGEYTKDELISMYSNTTGKYDIETNFFILSNIINNSYLDHTYEPYMQQFVTDYEKLSDGDKTGLANYVYFKYMYAKSHELSLYCDMTKANWQLTLGNQLYALYTDIKSITDDRDITRNYGLEALAYSVQTVSDTNTVTMDELNTYVSLVYDFANSISFQYQNYSFGFLKIMDLQNMVYVYNRNYACFIDQTIKIMKYLSNALVNKSSLFNGLNYYDKCNHGMFTVLLRKYIKIKSSIICIEKNNEAVIQNLTDIDKAYALSDIIKAGTPSEQNNICVSNYKSDVDSWFKPSNMGFAALQLIK